MYLTETGLAFVEGLALIASPCILPVLPLVLSASAEGGRRRPLGIITGFVLAFTLFALLSRKLVTALHIDLDVIKYTSLVLLLLFGAVLLSSKLSEKFSALTQGAANLGSKVAGNGEGGFVSGIVIGGLIGLVWTPCAGPVLAAVLVQIIRQQSDAASALILAAFAFGAGVPMLIIALTGRKIMNRLSLLTQHAETVRKAFGVIIIASALFIASGADVQALFSGSATTTGDALALQNGLASPYPAPAIAKGETWLNSEPLTIESLRGKVVLIDFWTYSCVNCVRTLPYITEWDKKYRDKGLVIIGVHAPEFEFEKNVDNVKHALVQHGIKYPVVLDSDLSTWTNYNNRYWPAHYLIDKDGKVVYTHFGEGEYDVTENNIRYLLGLKEKAAAEAASEKSVADQTPETYLGYARMQRYAGEDKPVHDTQASYHLPGFVPLHSWGLSGKWSVEKQKIVAGEKGAAITLNFKARKVYLVMGTNSGRPVTVSIALNGKAVKIITVDRNTLYELVDQKTAKNGEVTIKAESPGLEAYAFTFGG